MHNCTEVRDADYLTRLDNSLVCIGCHKHPSELDEYDPDATGYDLTPAEYVEQEEGTLNTGNGHFLCTECYIKAGQPSRPAPDRWIAP